MNLNKMTNEQILKKAIEKAIRGGYNSKLGKKLIEHLDLLEAGHIAYTKGGKVDFFCIIFSHDFCQAFWGEEKVRRAKEIDGKLVMVFEGFDWQYYLQQMVLEKDPLKYLKKFL